MTLDLRDAQARILALNSEELPFIYALGAPGRPKRHGPRRTSERVRRLSGKS